MDELLKQLLAEFFKSDKFTFLMKDMEKDIRKEITKRLHWQTTQGLRELLGFGSESTFRRWHEEGWLGCSRLTDHSKPFWYVPDIFERLDHNHEVKFDNEVIFINKRARRTA